MRWCISIFRKLSRTIRKLLSKLLLLLSFVSSYSGKSIDKRLEELDETVSLRLVSSFPLVPISQFSRGSRSFPISTSFPFLIAVLIERSICSRSNTPSQKSMKEWLQAVFAGKVDHEDNTINFSLYDQAKEFDIDVCIS